MPLDPLVTVTCPAAPSATVTRFDSIERGVKETLAPAGRAEPAGYTVSAPGLRAFFAVTLRTTEAAPVTGTPPCPATVKDTEPFAATGVLGAPRPVVVSRTRAHGTET